MAAERKLKGINFVGTLEALARTHGAEARARVEARLRGDAGELVRGRAVVASGWYPAAHYAALLDAIVAELRDEDAVRALSREAVKADFATLFRIVRLFMSPEKALQQSMRISSRYIDGGDVSVVDVGERFIHYRFRDYHGYTRRMWWDFIGGIEGVLETLGVEDIRSRVVAGGQDGDDSLELIVRWR
ncbi:MAG: hypothetical protein KF729_12295 [Sandaracinaceae bacterium]|nr:hypothetical protein [Sandaracinaceae bacterium]